MTHLKNQSITGPNTYTRKPVLSFGALIGISSIGIPSPARKPASQGRVPLAQYYLCGETRSDTPEANATARLTPKDLLLLGFLGAISITAPLPHIGNLHIESRPMILTEHECTDVLDWHGAIEALRQGHLRPRPKLGDRILEAGDRKLVSRCAWIEGLGFLIKGESVLPGNPQRGLPSVQGVVTLYDDDCGSVRA